MVVGKAVLRLVKKWLASRPRRAPSGVAALPPSTGLGLLPRDLQEYLVERAHDEHEVIVIDLVLGEPVHARVLVDRGPGNRTERTESNPPAGRQTPEVSVGREIDVEFGVRELRR